MVHPELPITSLSSAEQQQQGLVRAGVGVGGAVISVGGVWHRRSEQQVQLLFTLNELPLRADGCSTRRVGGCFLLFYLNKTIYETKKAFFFACLQSHAVEKKEKNFSSFSFS